MQCDDVIGAGRGGANQLSVRLVGAESPGARIVVRLAEVLVPIDQPQHPDVAIEIYKEDNVMKVGNPLPPATVEQQVAALDRHGVVLALTALRPSGCARKQASVSTKALTSKVSGAPMRSRRRARQRCR